MSHATNNREVNASVKSQHLIISDFRADISLHILHPNSYRVLSKLRGGQFKTYPVMLLLLLFYF